MLKTSSSSVSVNCCKELSCCLQTLLMTLRKQSIENIVGKGKKMLVIAFPPFRTMFSTLSKTKIIILATSYLSSANALNLLKSKKLLFGNRLPQRYSFWRFKNRQLLKTLEKEEIARNEQFLLFPQCFLLNHIIVSLFVHSFDIISLLAASGVTIGRLITVL